MVVMLLYARSMVKLKYDGNVRDTKSDYVCTDLGADHDEVAERELMKRKMEARRKAELKLFRLDLMKQLNGIPVEQADEQLPVIELDEGE